MKTIYCLIGNIGVGKTSLVKKLNEEGFNCAFEQLDKISYLQAYWKDSTFGLETQIGFYSMWLSLIKTDLDNLFIDCSILEYHEVFTRYMYDKNIIDENEWDLCCYLYNSVIQLIQDNYNIKHILINCSLDKVSERIRMRNRTNEKNDFDFISQIDVYLKKFIASNNVDIVIDGNSTIDNQYQEIISKIFKEEK